MTKETHRIKFIISLQIHPVLKDILQYFSVRLGVLKVWLWKILRVYYSNHKTPCYYEIELSFCESFVAKMGCFVAEESVILFFFHFLYSSSANKVLRKVTDHCIVHFPKAFFLVIGLPARKEAKKVASLVVFICCQMTLLSSGEK